MCGTFYLVGHLWDIVADEPDKKELRWSLGKHRQTKIGKH